MPRGNSYFLTPLNSKDSLIAEHQPSPAEDSGQSVAPDEGKIEKNPDADVASHGTRTEQAETRTEQAMRRGGGFLEKPFPQEHFLTSLFPRADGGQAEFGARPIVD